MTALWRAAMRSALAADAAGHIRDPCRPDDVGDGAEKDWILERDDLERRSLVRAHASARARCDQVEGVRIWTTAQEGVAPAAGFVRATLAVRYGLGEVAPRELLELAGAAAVGRLLSRGDRRAAAAVQAGLPAGQQRAFDAWRDPAHPVAALIVAGTMAAQISHPAGPILTSGLCVVALAGRRQSAGPEGSRWELSWDPTATLASYDRALSQAIRGQLTAFPDGAEGAVSWLHWAAELAEGGDP